MYKLVLLRHGQSVYNQQDIFTGWLDCDLSEQGIKEAKQAGQLLKENGFTFDVAYTSYLKRAIRTLWLALDEMDLLWIPTYKTWRLNERHYGNLQGLNKVEMVQKVGAEQVHIWRRSYDIPPPSLTINDPMHPSHDLRYASIPKEELPATESLALCVKRVMPYWEQEIVPAITAGKKLIIAAHGNSLRGIVMHLDGLSKEEILELNIPTGFPLVYELDENLKVIKKYYLGNQEDIKKAIEKNKTPGKK